MRRAARLLLLAAAFFLAGTVWASPRPYLGDGSCLSCHGEQLPTLPSSGCLSCHAGNSSYLSDHAGGDQGGLAAAGAVTGGLLAGLLVLGLAVWRRAPAALALAAATALAAPSPPGTESPVATGTGPHIVARGFACDLQAVLSPSGGAVLFARRGPDTDGNGAVDLRDGQALFLLARGGKGPRRLTPYALDFQPKMARWSADGSAFVVPCPTSDADGDGAIGIGDPSGLALFDREGRQLSALPPAGEDLRSPAFSPDGRRVAYVDGRGIGVWDTLTGSREAALSPLPEGQFPRLWGWDLAGSAPLFSRGHDYRTLARTRGGHRAFPAEVPLEVARDGRAVTLTPPGPVPLRRYAAQASDGRLFYLARSEGAPTALYSFDGRNETRWSPESAKALGCFTASSRGVYAWLGTGDGSARLALVHDPTSVHFIGESAPGLQLGVAGSDRAALASAPGGSGLLFARGETASQTEACRATPGTWFAPAAAGESFAAVRVTADGDGDGRFTALDEGELIVWWGSP
jgi:dipeptidyl aminopeptidase/acylaminoacyl peptidase